MSTSQSAVNVVPYLSAVEMSYDKALYKSTDTILRDIAGFVSQMPLLYIDPSSFTQNFEMFT